MVSSWRWAGYDSGVKANIRNVLTFAGIVIGVFLITTVTVFFLVGFSEDSVRSVLLTALISGAVVAGLSLPAFIWISLRTSSAKQYSAYALEEIDLDEEELADAIGNWVYSRYKRRMENEARFLEDEDGEVSCRVTVRKD